MYNKINKLCDHDVAVSAGWTATPRGLGLIPTTDEMSLGFRLSLFLTRSDELLMPLPNIISCMSTHRIQLIRKICGIIRRNIKCYLFIMFRKYGWT